MQFLLCASLGAFSMALTSPGMLGGQTQEQTSQKRISEFTLGRLRPGQDTFEAVERLYPTVYWVRRIGTFYLTDPCASLTMVIDTELGTTVNSVRIEPTEGSEEPCERNTSWYWGTGKGLEVGDAKSKVYLLYGEPNSVSPSTRNSQPVELIHYAFDWAGPDVPQTMEVVCAAPKDGTPGRVVEITLAAGSL